MAGNFLSSLLALLSAACSEPSAVATAWGCVCAELTHCAASLGARAQGCGNAAAWLLDGAGGL